MQMINLLLAAFGADGAYPECTRALHQKRKDHEISMTRSIQ